MVGLYRDSSRRRAVDPEKIKQAQNRAKAKAVIAEAEATIGTTVDKLERYTLLANAGGLALAVQVAAALGTETLPWQAAASLVSFGIGVTASAIALAWRIYKTERRVMDVLVETGQVGMLNFDLVSRYMSVNKVRRAAGSGIAEAFWTFASRFGFIIGLWCGIAAIIFR